MQALGLAEEYKSDDPAFKQFVQKIAALASQYCLALEFSKKLHTIPQVHHPVDYFDLGQRPVPTPPVELL